MSIFSGSTADASPRRSSLHFQTPMAKSRRIKDESELLSRFRELLHEVTDPQFCAWLVTLARIRMSHLRDHALCSVLRVDRMQAMRYRSVSTINLFSEARLPELALESLLVTLDQALRAAAASRLYKSAPPEIIHRTFMQ
ncbi:hypothetical protein HPB50_028881 [Hyalomma asiaticum]|nr:hypothetical protein HPB50_028881 [Hyalomma asiaticum]